MPTNDKYSNEPSLYKSQCHKNYYQFLYNTDNSAAVRTAMKRDLLNQWLEPRRRSSSDVSSAVSSGTRAQQISTEPTSEPSLVRSNISGSISSEVKSPVEIVNEITTYEQQSSQAEQPNENGEPSNSSSDTNRIKGQTLVVQVDVHKPSPTRQLVINCLRRKSKSWDSFFVQSETQKEENNSSNSGNDKKEKYQFVSKIKEFFSTLRSPNRCPWITTQPVPPSSVGSVSHGSQQSLKDQLLSPKRSASSTKLTELKASRPVQSLKVENELTQQVRLRSISSERYKTKANTFHSERSIEKRVQSYAGNSEHNFPSNIERNPTSHQSITLDNFEKKHLSVFQDTLESTPPPPAPPEPSSNPNQHVFYIEDDENTNNTEKRSTLVRRVYLKTANADSEASTTVGNTYNFKKLSKGTESSFGVIHFEPPQKYECYDKQEKQQTYSTKSYQQQPDRSYYHRRPFHRVGQYLNTLASIDFEIQNLDESQRYATSQQQTTQYRNFVYFDDGYTNVDDYDLTSSRVTLNHHPQIHYNNQHFNLKNYDSRPCTNTFNTYSREPQPSTSWANQPSTSREPEYDTNRKPQTSTSWANQPSTSRELQHNTFHTYNREPQPSTSWANQPSTSREPEYDTNRKPQTSTSWGTQPSTNREPRHNSSLEPRPSTSWAIQPSSTRESLPKTSQEPRPSTSWAPQPSATREALPKTSQEPRPSTSWATQSIATREPLPHTNLEPRPSTSWATQHIASREPLPNTSQEPRPSTSWATQPIATREPLPHTNLEPRPSTSWATQHIASREPLPNTSQEPRPSTSWATQPIATREPLPHTSQEPRPSTSWATQSIATREPLPHTSLEPRPSTSWTTQPIATREPLPQTSQDPRPSTNWATQPIATREQLPHTSQEPRPSTSWATQHIATREPLPHTSQEPRPSTSWATQPIATREPLPNTSQEPRPSTSWATQPIATREPLPNTSVEPRPSTSWATQPIATREPLPNTSQEPRPSTSWATQPIATREPLPNTSQEPRPSTSWATQPIATREPLPNTSVEPRPSTSWATQHIATREPLPNTSQEPRPSTSWATQPIATREPLPHTSQEPRPSTSWATQPIATREPLPNTSIEPRPSTSWAPQPIATREPRPSTSRDPQHPFQQPKQCHIDTVGYQKSYTLQQLYKSRLAEQLEERRNNKTDDLRHSRCVQFNNLTDREIISQESGWTDTYKGRDLYQDHYSAQQRAKEYSGYQQADRAERPAYLSKTLDSYTNNSFWRRDNIYHRELESPWDLEHSETSDTAIDESLKTHRDYRKQYSEDYFLKYYQRPVLVPEYFEEPVYQDYPQEIGWDRAISSHNQHFERTSSVAPSYREERRSHHNSITDHISRMGSHEDHERKIIIEFCHLLEKSKQLFNGLRELPQYGHKQWHSYFGRTFDVYTKLWKFQQQHRAILDTKYGLKRWQIGEIASKIGQLYYHFYLRTSETAYLNEAFSFYFAIRGRSYYTKASKEDKCELMVKKLRYYARFIVVCLLLKKIKLVKDLIKELDRQIIEYGNTYDPDDQIEWTVVVDEVKAFLHAESVVSVVHPDNYPVILYHRLSVLTTPPVERSALMTLSLQEVIIVGSNSHQVKFSELTMDMFRMLQTLEREPTGDIQQTYDESPRQRYNVTPSALNNKGYNLEAGAPHCENPHKYLLFKPTPNQILVYLSSSCDDLPPNGALLVYMSAEGQIGTPSKHIEDGYDIGGLITTSKNDVHRDSNKDQKNSQSKYRDVNSFHPGDMFPFTRKPLFVIIDSDNSYAFQNMPRHFGQPLIILMSPLELPPTLHISTSDRRNQGNLFTLFLHSPLTAFCFCCDIHTMSLVHWEKAQAFVDTFLAEASLIVTRSRIDPQFISFMGDDFLRLLILRFVFCEVVLRMHRLFKTRAQLARSAPPIPDDILEHPTLTRIVMDLAIHLQVRSHFQDTPATSLPSNKE